MAQQEFPKAFGVKRVRVLDLKVEVNDRVDGPLPSAFLAYPKLFKEVFFAPEKASDRVQQKGLAKPSGLIQKAKSVMLNHSADEPGFVDIEIVSVNDLRKTTKAQRHRAGVGPAQLGVMAKGGFDWGI